MPRSHTPYNAAVTAGRTGIERGRAGAVLGSIVGTLAGACAVSWPGVHALLVIVPGGLLGGIAAGAVIGATTGVLLGLTFADFRRLPR